MASTLALRGVPAARRAEGPASCGARAPRATAGGVRGSARPRLAHAPWHSPTPPPRASTRARAFAVDRGEALGDDDDALAERFVDATRGQTRRANAGCDANAFVAHDKDQNDVDPHFTEDLLLSLSSRDEDATTRGKIASPTRRGGNTKKNARVFKNASLGKYCTLGLGGNARVVVEVYTIEQLVSTLRLCASLDAPRVVVGKGSNVLFADAGFDGVAIVNRVAFVEEEPEDDDCFKKTDDDPSSASNKKETRLFRVGSGTPFNALGASLSRRSWSGLEFAAGVPGTAGGAAFMNAGADGQDTASVLSSVELVSPCGRFRATAEISSDPSDPNASTKTEDDSRRRDDDDADIRIRRFAINREDAFGYRRSPFMDDDDGHEEVSSRDGETRAEARHHASDADEHETETETVAGWIVLAVTFRLTRDARAASRARAFASRRRASQPLAERSVGCLFRNPGEGENSAGAAIDRAGLKNHAVGNARVSSRHANFLVVDRDDAVGSRSRSASASRNGTRDMEALIAEVKARVLESTGLVLEEEVRRVPFRTIRSPTIRSPGPGVTRNDSKRAFRRTTERNDDANAHARGDDSRTGPR